MGPVTAATWSQQFTVDAQAAALLIAELARRHAGSARATWGRIVGLTSGTELGFPSEVSYGAAKAAQVSYTMSAAVELAPMGITANMVQPGVTDTGWVTDPVRQAVATSGRLFTVATPWAGRRSNRISGVGDAASSVTGNVDPASVMTRRRGEDRRREEASAHALHRRWRPRAVRDFLLWRVDRSASLNPASFGAGSQLLSLSLPGESLWMKSVRPPSVSNVR